MKLAITLLAAAATLCGCALPPKTPVRHVSEFNSAEHAAYLAAGTATVQGQAFLRQRGGGIVSCAGRTVTLMPTTPYFQEVADLGRGGHYPDYVYKIPKADRGVVRETVCDAQGNFVFDGLAPLNWQVMVYVGWEVNGSQQGGMLFTQTAASAGKTTRLVLTDVDRLR